MLSPLLSSKIHFVWKLSTDVIGVFDMRKVKQIQGMGRWMDGWVVGWVDGWTDGGIDWTDGHTLYACLA